MNEASTPFDEQENGGTHLEGKRPGKKPYRAPKLTAYGDVRTVVLAGTDPFPEDSTSGTPRRPRVP